MGSLPNLFVNINITIDTMLKFDANLAQTLTLTLHVNAPKAEACEYCGSDGIDPLQLCDLIAPLTMVISLSAPAVINETERS